MQAINSLIQFWDRMKYRADGSRTPDTSSDTVCSTCALTRGLLQSRRNLVSVSVARERKSSGALVSRAGASTIDHRRFETNQRTRLLRVSTVPATRFGTFRSAVFP